MLWAILIVVAAVGFYVLHRLLFLETAPVVPQSKLGLEKTKIGTKKPKAEKKNDKAAKVTKKDTHFDKYTKDKDSDEEDNVKEAPQQDASPSSPAKTQFATPVSKKAQNKALREGFVTIEKKARNQPTAEEREKRDALRKEEEEELKKKEEARKLRQKERAEKEALEKEKKKEESNEQSIKDILEKQRKEKEAQKLARSGANKGGVVKVFSATEQANKKWEASPTVQVGEGSHEVDEDSFPQLGK